MDYLRWDERPTLRRPVIVAAFEGWNDAGDAATMAARFLARVWSGRRFASIDPEEFYDFTTTRPQVRLEDGVTRRIDWPANEFMVASPPGSAHDVVVLVGTEPQLRWRSFTGCVTTVARELGVELVITLGALLADVPHTRPVRVMGTAVDQKLITRLGLQRSSYEGPTGIVGVLHDRLRSEGLASVSLWAGVPHYVGRTTSPKAALALVRRTVDLVGAQAQTTELEIASAAYERQVTEAVSVDDEMTDYVRRLEIDDEEEATAEIPTAEALAIEVEQFLRDQQPPPGG